MRKIDADAFGRFLADWQLSLRNANECGGCEAELLGQVMKALDEQPTLNEKIVTVLEYSIGAFAIVCGIAMIALFLYAIFRL